MTEFLYSVFFSNDTVHIGRAHEYLFDGGFRSMWNIFQKMELLKTYRFENKVKTLKSRDLSD